VLNKTYLAEISSLDKRKRLAGERIVVIGIRRLALMSFRRNTYLELQKVISASQKLILGKLYRSVGQDLGLHQS